MSSTPTWKGTPPKECDLCRLPLTLTFIDGKTRAGPWGNMCGGCHTRYGVGLGTGRGQRYTWMNGHWEKTAG
jgi:hypothetical protein